jgi:hypothetical protein
MGRAKWHNKRVRDRASSLRDLGIRRALWSDETHTFLAWRELIDTSDGDVCCEWCGQVRRPLFSYNDSPPCCNLRHWQQWLIHERTQVREYVGDDEEVFRMLLGDEHEQ